MAANPINQNILKAGSGTERVEGGGVSVLSNFTLLINCRSRRPSRGDLKSFRGKEASCDERAGIQRERLLFRDNFEGNFTGKGILEFSRVI